MLLAAGGAMAEAAVLLIVAPAARSLAPQATALAPLAVFHDLRWLYGYSGSWAGFAGVLIVLAVARTGLDAAMVGLAWPAGQDRPRLAVLLRSSAAAALLAGVLLSPLVTLVFGVALLPFSWPLLTALPVLLLVVALLSHGGVVTWWWRVLPPVRAVGWVLADFVALSAAAALTGWLPGPWAIPVAGLAGLCNARAWYGVVRALTVPRPERSRVRRPARRLPVAPVAALAAVALVIGVARLAFSTHSGGARAHVAAQAVEQLPGSSHALVRTGAPGPAGPRPPVLAVEGFGSSCCSGPGALRALSAGGIVQQFSYRGLGENGQPEPYGRAASDLPLPVLGDRIAAQVWRLHRQTGKPVDVVAESEGTLGIYAMLARHPHVPLGSIVMLSPILDPGQVSYAAAAGGGPGVVPGYELRAILSFIGSLSPYGSSGAQTLVSSVNKSGARFAGAALALARDRPFRWLAVVPLADAVTLPACALPSGAVVVPALHGGLAGDPRVQGIVRTFLAGRAVRAEPGLQSLAQTVSSAASAWRMPVPTANKPSCLPGAAVAAHR
jgi:hypothetical protein